MRSMHPLERLRCQNVPSTRAKTLQAKRNEAASRVEEVEEFGMITFGFVVVFERLNLLVFAFYEKLTAQSFCNGATVEKRPFGSAKCCVRVTARDRHRSIQYNTRQNPFVKIHRDGFIVVPFAFLYLHFSPSSFPHDRDSLCLPI